MKPSVLRICVLVAVLVALVSLGYAEETKGTADGKVGLDLANQLYCDARGLFSGALGKLLGLLMVFSGLWGMIRGGKMVAGLIVIAFGAILPALPYMIESTLSGLGNLMIQSKMSDGKLAFNPPTCSGQAITVKQKTLDDEYNTCRAGGSVCM